jgi:hypothetical protein
MGQRTVELFQMTSSWKSNDRQDNSQYPVTKKDKRWSTKHYTENERTNNTKLTNNFE